MRPAASELPHLHLRLHRSAGASVRQGDTLYYLLTDHLGSTSVSYNTSTGAVSAQRYTPYGAPRGPASTLPTDYKFTGQRAEAGLGSLYDYNARFYSPALGRFLSPDTLVPAPGNPQALNRYSYTLNNPTKYRDPTGHWVESAFDVISLGMTVNDIRKEGLTFWNVVSLVTDMASVALPIVPAGVSHLIRAGKLANKADDVVDAAGIIRAADDVPDIIWRSGDPSPSNLTPRPEDKGLLSFRDSLSNPWPLPPGQRPPLPADKPYFGIDTTLLPKGSVVRDGRVGSVAAPPGHVSVGGVPPQALKSAVTMRGKPGLPPKRIKLE